MADADMLSFSEIELTRPEMKLLESLQHKSLYATDDLIAAAERLRHFGFVRMQPVPKTANVPVVHGGLSIAIFLEDRGRDYYAFAKRKQADSRTSKLHDWKIAVISGVIVAAASAIIQILLAKLL